MVAAKLPDPFKYLPRVALTCHFSLSLPTLEDISMELITSPEALQQQITTYKEKALTTGFVPTMGALHEGHISLITRSVSENNRTISSIFVNPAQFNDPNDLARYPRTPEKDYEMLEKAGCDLIFSPSADDVYPGGVQLLDLHLGSLAEVMEGKFRPGHFQGMVTIVHHLLRLVKPDNAYFGEKDFQQLAIIRFMVQKLGLPVSVIGCRTIREPDGLAMSSRNIHLTAEERLAAPVIYQTMKKYAGQVPLITVSGFRSAVTKEINGTGLLKVEYLDVVDAETLEAISSWQGAKEARACIAVHTSRTRLIDNIGIALAQPL